MENIFALKLINWYQQYKRDLPWRKTKDPYKIWLSEIILQQTRVAQGAPYYISFVENFPSIHDLAKADEQEVLKLWQGLGYYSRARNLHATAKKIVLEHDGEFPNTFDKLLKLKGIGDYTASAIASFCFDEVVPTLDGNVYRVLSRFLGIETPIDSHQAKKEFKNIAFELINPKNPGIFNQAIMEFGALQCTPSSPNCSNCIFNDSCVALQKNKVQLLPIKNKKLKIKKRFFNYLIYKTPAMKTMIERREKNDIWKHLFQFPLIETESELDILNFYTFLEKSAYKDLKIKNIKLINPTSTIHKLTHQEINIKFWEINLEYNSNELIDWNQISQFPFPIIIHNFIEKYMKDC